MNIDWCYDSIKDILCWELNLNKVYVRNPCLLAIFLGAYIYVINVIALILSNKPVCLWMECNDDDVDGGRGRTSSVWRIDHRARPRSFRLEDEPTLNVHLVPLNSKTKRSCERPPPVLHWNPNLNIYRTFKTIIVFL